MRWIHLLGLGFVVGLTALGIATSIALLRWNEIAFMEKPAAEGVQAAPGKQASAMPAEAVQGQTIFRQKCQSCHTIGGGKQVGPDLKGVTQQRPRDYLVQMITNPEAALKTPTGQQLLQEYGVPMPNVGVNQQQAEQLLAYIDFQSGAAAPAKAGAPQQAGQPAPQASPATKAPPGGAPTKGDPAKGKTSFDSKCASCHNIGGGRKVGPDLRGVTAQRSHDYLVNMITQPDRMTASDPTAQQLLKDYGVQMPNLGIQPAEAEDIIAHIQQQSGGALAPSHGVPVASGLLVEHGPAPMMASAQLPAIIHQLSALMEPLFQQPAGNAQQGKTLFDQRCMGCHTIGGGNTAGPDLKGVTVQRPHDWLIRMIVDPAALIASDPQAQQLAQEFPATMPNLGVTSQQAEDILAHIQQQSGGAAPGGTPAQPAQPVQPGNAANGQALFTGQKGFSAGGPACIACHNVEGIGIMRGGTWGLDLTKQQTKMGTNGIVGIIKSPAFPGMKEAYANHPVTDAEAADLAAFFIDVDSRQPSSFPEIIFPAVGLLIFLVMMGIAGIAWLGRTRKVRESLVGGTRR